MGVGHLIQAFETQEAPDLSGFSVLLPSTCV
jgi:hypothetical protein